MVAGLPKLYQESQSPILSKERMGFFIEYLQVTRIARKGRGVKRGVSRECVTLQGGGKKE